jgi:hypothetical protein
MLSTVATTLQLIAIELKNRLICISNRLLQFIREQYGSVAVSWLSLLKRHIDLSLDVHVRTAREQCGQPLPRICRQSLLSDLKRNVACTCFSDPSS